MKAKKLFLALGLALSVSSFAQQFGVSAQTLLMFQVQRAYNVQYSDRIVKSGTAPAIGLRVETNYILPGYGIPVSAYNGLGITYLAPATDSAVFRAHFRNSWQNDMDVIGTQRTSMFSIGLRCGYEFPQEFDEFLIIHYGWGLAWTQSRTINVLPEQSSTFNYTKDDFKEEDFEPITSNGGTLEVLVGGIYEFEKFSLIGQYSLLLPVLGYD